MHILIVGSGPAAAAAAMFLCAKPEVEVTMIDVGAVLEPEKEAARRRLGSEDMSTWSREDLDLISRTPVATSVKGVPEKRAFGSDFPLRDFGQLDGVNLSNGVNPSMVSGAYGGFSNMWGAQVMPFSRATFDRWPVSYDEMVPHYRTILQEIPYAAEEDDLAHVFPLIGESPGLPALSPRTESVLHRYGRAKEPLNAEGVVLGRARLALNASTCQLTRLCLSGCPFDSIYSAAQTVDRLRRDKGLRYLDGLIAVRVEESDRPVVLAKEISSGRIVRFAADRVLVACGGLGSSRLVIGSLGLFARPVRVAESAQFMLPFVSRLTIPDPGPAPSLALNQFNMTVDPDHDGINISQLHFYTYNDGFLDALPPVLRRRRMLPARQALIRRTSVALGYLPSWQSPGLSLEAAPARDGELPHVTVRAIGGALSARLDFYRVLSRVTQAAPSLDLWPVLPKLVISAPGKSYHWGGTFPHSASPKGEFSSDRLGRVGPWRRVHLIDASVFPTVAATTFTLTIMANAHRIAQAIHAEDPA